jgi:hypothetical protein
MNRILLITVILLHCVTAFSQQLAPISKTVGKLNITVDPRMELLSAVQVISDYPAINRKVSYSNELMKFFGKNKTLEAPILTNQLYKDQDFAQDAPVNLILCLSQVPELKITHPFTDRLIERAGGQKNLKKYCSALHDFALKSNFVDFWNNKTSYYQKIVEYTADDLGDFDPVGKLESYYNESKNSYTVTLSPSLAGGYGIRIPSPDDGLDIYACLDAGEMKDNIPYYSKLGLSYFLWHEFSHSYANPLTEKYKTRITASSKLFVLLENEMKEKVWGSWQNCIDEHIIRAVYIRLLTLYGRENEAKSQFIREKSLHYLYIEPLVEKLKQFENERQTKNLTFSGFYPTLLGVLDSLASSDNEKLLHPAFNGPIQALLSSPKIIIIYPTNDSDTAALNNIYRYTSLIQKIKSDERIIRSDTAALKMDLSDYSIMAYGTIESNLFLSKFKEMFPFKIKGNTILTNKIHEGARLRIITCLPNPYNNKKGMLINSSTSNRNIKGVTNPFTDDFIIFEDIDNILQQGSYQKDGTRWRY